MVIPALNAAALLPAALAALGAAPAEVIVVDGGSADATARIAEAAGAIVIAAPRGRGGQIAAGVAAARGPWLRPVPRVPHPVFAISGFRD